MGHAENKREAIEKTLLLLQFTPEGVSIAAIARNIGCNPSTAHRYLKEIEKEYPLQEISRGHFRLDPAQMLSNVSLYPDEALMVYLALRRFIRQTGRATTFMISAIQKIIPALKRPDLQEMLMESLQSLEAERPALQEYTDLWKTLLRGWRENTVVRIRYLKAHSDEADEHDIEPYLFEPMPFGDGIYLIAWSRTRNALRTIKPDRIQRAVLTAETFERRLDLTAETLLRHAWGIWYGEAPVTVELKFSSNVARRVQETIYLPTEQKQLLPDGSLLWSAQVVGTLEILSWIRGWGPGVEVLKPDDLRQRVIKELKEALALYE